MYHTVAVLIVAVIRVFHIPKDRVNKHLYNAGAFLNRNILRSHVYHAECEISPESRVDVSGTEQHSFPTKGGTAAKCCGEIGRETDELHRRDKGQLARFHNSVFCGTEVDPVVRSFTTSGAKAESSFCAINDTHIQWEPLDLVLGKVEELKPAVLVHLGDASETMPTVESQVEMFLAPPVRNNAYAAERGVLFCPGNHDQWGFANRTLERVFMFRQPEERSSRDWDLGRNFAFRQGDIALIGLDTGIHWRDDYPQAGGVFANDAYRVAQTRWLAEGLERPDVKSAPYIVANCHVPVYDRKEDPVRIDWQRAWGELFTKAGVQVVLVGHTHVYRYDPPAAGRTWAQIVGGSPNMELPDFPDRWPTVIHGRVEKGELRITVHDTLYKRIAGDFTYKPRG